MRSLRLWSALGNEALGGAFLFVTVLAVAACRFDGGPEPPPVRIYALGDQGMGTTDAPADRFQYRVGQALASRQAAAPAEAVLLLGDNFYPGGVSSTADPQFETAFRDPYPAAALPLPFWVVLGNHDHLPGGSAQAQYDYADPEGRWILDRPDDVRQIEWDGRPVAEVYLFDSDPLVRGVGGASAQAAALVARARNSSVPWKILALHHPLRSSGLHGNTPQTAQAFGAAADSGVFQLVLAGHDHNLEVQRTPESDHVVAGGGGAPPRAWPAASASPQTLWGQGSLGFVEVEMTAQDLTLRFWDAQEVPALLFETHRVRGGLF